MFDGMNGMAILKRKAIAVGAGLVAAILMSGCSGANVEIESKLLNSLGIIGKGAKAENKLVDRPPLVPPPTSKLPVPGSGRAPETAAEWPIEYADNEARIAALKKKKEYEDKGDWSKNRDPDEFEKLLDPLARKKGIFGDWSADIGRGAPEGGVGSP